MLVLKCQNVCLLWLRFMKNQYTNETPPIEVFINPKMPYIKNVFDIIDLITSRHLSLKNYNEIPNNNNGKCECKIEYFDNLNICEKMYL